MKKILIPLILLVSVCQLIYNQTVPLKGRAIAEIFTDFHFNIKDTSRTTGFSLNRAFLGYNFPAANNFSATVIVNVGKPDDLPSGSQPGRYAYFREASISYSTDNLKIAMGITGTRLFDFQQRFWGKRYIANTYQSINGYGFVADLGLAVDFRINDVFKTDVTIMNGEGYTNVQLDNSIKSSLGLTITPDSHFAIRLYGDLIKTKGLWQPMIVSFIGFKNEKFTIGGEFTYKSNLDLISGHNAWGLSFTGATSIAKQTELFARFDHSTSVIVPGEENPWNHIKDGNFLVLGIQHVFNENVRIALDYQGNYPFSSGFQNAEAIFVNALFRF
jgi:hypothetical protein